LRLAFGRRQSVVRAVADLDRVVVVECAGAAVRLPVRDLGESGLHAVPAGQRVAAAAAFAVVALDVAAGAPAVRVLLPGGRGGDGQVVGQLQVDRPTGLPQRRRPRLDVGDVARADAVDLDVVHAPGGELIRPRVDELLCAGLGVIDPYHALAVVVLLAGRGRDFVDAVRGAQDVAVRHHGVLRTARSDVEAALEPVGVHVVGDDLDAVGRAAGRELRGVGEPAAVRVHVRALIAGTLVPEVVDIDVLVPHRRQAAALHRIRLGVDLRGGRIVPDEAPAAPAQRGRGTHAVALRLGAGRVQGAEREGGCGRGERQGHKGGGLSGSRAHAISFRVFRARTCLGRGRGSGTLWP